jgi:hypothetical protein
MLSKGLVSTAVIIVSALYPKSLSGQIQTAALKTSTGKSPAGPTPSSQGEQMSSVESKTPYKMVPSRMESSSSLDSAGWERARSA